MKKLIILYFLISIASQAQDIAILKYDGGGDWYANPTALPNLIDYSNNIIHTEIKKNQKLLKPQALIFLIIQSYL